MYEGIKLPGKFLEKERKSIKCEIGRKRRKGVDPWANQGKRHAKKNHSASVTEEEDRLTT